MEKFTSIESLKHIVANVRKHYNKIGKPFPTLNFKGTVKLHGTNAGVRRTPSGKIQPQSRERILDITSDNYGFAFFIETNKFIVEQLFSDFPKDADVTLYGEWCGGNIQPSVALTQVPKHWVLFAVKVDGVYQPLPVDICANEVNIYNIGQIPSYHVEIDFLSPEPASEILADLTLTVEKECPWVKFIYESSIKECVYNTDRIDWMNVPALLPQKLKEIENNIFEYGKLNNLKDGDKLTFEVL